VLRITRRALAHERPIEVSRSVFRGDRYTMWLQLGEGD
jgi:GntR family transcriptional regulator